MKIASFLKPQNGCAQHRIMIIPYLLGLRAASAEISRNVAETTAIKYKSRDDTSFSFCGRAIKWKLLGVGMKGPLPL